MRRFSCLEDEFNRRETGQNTRIAELASTAGEEVRTILFGFGNAEVKMIRAFRHTSLLLILLFTLGALGAAQSSEGTKSSPDNPPTSPSDPTTVDGQPVYKVGNGVTSPRAIYSPDPEYSDQARKKKFQGTCVLGLIVGADGNPRDIRVTQRLGKGLDEQAITAVKKWKFEPGRKDGQPVAVQINVEVTFRIR
jgi:TonB family protein